MQDDVDVYVRYHAATDWSPATVRSHFFRMRIFMRWLAKHGHDRWSSIGPHDLDAFMRDLIDQGRSRGTRRNYAWMIRCFFAWLAQRGKVLVDPSIDVDEVITVGDEPLLPAPLSEDDVTRLLDIMPRRHVRDLRNRLHVELLYGCALRLSESVNLAVSDLDVRDRTVLVRGGKGDKDRRVPMMNGVLNAAKDYLAVRREFLRGPDHGRLLLDFRGRPLDKKVIQHVLERYSKILGVHIHPHLLRHSIAVHLLRRGVDVRIIQELLGHAQLDTTKTYLRLIPGHLREDYDNAMPPIDVEADREY